MHSENPQAEVVRLSIAETMLTPFQQPVLHIVHVSLDLFLYYRWYHIIREGKQTHWSAVSRIIPTALFVDGKGIFSSLLAQYQLVIIENTIWSGGLKFYIWFPSVFSGKFHPILVTYWHLKCLFHVKIPVHALHTLLTSVLQIIYIKYRVLPSVFSI